MDAILREHVNGPALTIRSIVAAAMMTLASMAAGQEMQTERLLGDPASLWEQDAFIRSSWPDEIPERLDDVLPHGLLYRSYIAAPNEPRMATVLSYDVSEKSWHWDSTLGGRIGLYREEQPGFLNLDVWQVDLEGAAMPRLDPHRNMDVESVDYRFGLLWTAQQESLTFKLGYFHLSSHVGDEFLIANPTFQRVNFVRESLVTGTSYQASPEWRLYGETAWAMAVSGGAQPWQFQLGTEYAAIATRPKQGAPFSALNLHLREESDFAAGVSLMSGWQWTGVESGRAIRVGLQYYNGPTNQYEFLGRYDHQLGAGLWFDY